jgi:hypothetical protein
MLAVVYPSEPLMAEVPVLRVRAGEPVTEPLWVVYQGRFGVLPPALSIASGWDGFQFREWRRYTVGSVRKGGGVVTVRLDRDEGRLTDTPPGGDRAPFYEVSVADGSAWCTCRGFTLSNEPGRACKHVCCVSYVIAAGKLESEVGDGGQQAGGEGGPEGTGGGGRADRRAEDPV